MTMTLSARREPGRVGVEIDADDLVRPPYLDILVEWAVAAPPEEETFADELVIKDFERIHDGAHQVNRAHWPTIVRSRLYLKPTPDG
jgi:hypothetical protein